MSLAIRFETSRWLRLWRRPLKGSVAAALHLLPLRDPCAVGSNRLYDVAERIAGRVERHSRTSKMDHEDNTTRGKVVRTRLQLEAKVEVKSR